MRFFYTLLLSLCCLTASIQGYAADVEAKQTSLNIYQPAEHALPNDTVEDYNLLVVSGNVIATHIGQREISNHFYHTVDNNTTAYVLSDSFTNTVLSFSGSHAKAFIAKLIFPQHYYW